MTALESIRQSASGAALLADWLGDGGKTMPPRLAEKRAAVCAKCPVNEPESNWVHKFTGTIAETVRQQLEIKNKLELKTSQDDKLHICAGCGCTLGLKVWVPLAHIIRHTDAETMEKFDGDCWIPTEKKRLLLVIPCHSGDSGDASSLLDWIGELGGCPDNPLLLVMDHTVSVERQIDLKGKAVQFFPAVYPIIVPPKEGATGWPAGPNWMFQYTARHIASHLYLSWFWNEPDCIPLKRGWVESLEREYLMCGKPFMGALVHSSGNKNLPGDHLTGCAIYPPNAATYFEKAFGQPRAWDIEGAPEVFPLSHHTEQFLHFWGNGQLSPTWKEKPEPGDPENTLYTSKISPKRVVMHRNKDHTLIQVLRSKVKLRITVTGKPLSTCKTCTWWKPNRPGFTEGEESFCMNRKIWIKTVAELSCQYHMTASSTEYNVPQHADSGLEMKNANPVDGPVEILIVTYWKDKPWLEYCLRAIQKYCTGFQGVTVASPNPDPKGRFIALKSFEKMQAFGPVPIRSVYYDEVPGKGMLQHMVKMAEADLIVPAGTKYVLHCDADCIFNKPTSPENYFLNDKPYYLIRSWESLTDRESKATSDCAQWKGPTDEQLGFDTKWYTMCMNTTALPVGFYPAYREYLVKLHGKPFQTLMLEGKNEFPQTRMDWTAMGAWAEKFMHDRFTWLDVEKEKYPEDRKKAFWSHGGVTPENKTEMEGFLK